MARNESNWFSRAIGGSRFWRLCCCRNEVDELTDEPIYLYRAQMAAAMSQPAKENKKRAVKRQTIGVHLPIHSFGKSERTDEDRAASATDNLLRTVRVGGPVSDGSASARPVIQHYDSIKMTQLKGKKRKLTRTRRRQRHCDYDFNEENQANEQIEKYKGGARKKFVIPQVINTHSSSDDDFQ